MNKASLRMDPFMDQIFIEDLTVETVIGVYEWEHDIRQQLVLNIEMSWDISTAAKDDALEHTIDYDGVSRRLTDFIENGQFLLVETVAERCADILLHEFHIPKVRIKVAKPGAVKNARAVGVCIERQRRAH
jgi:dihydroneopterin aldolase